MQKELDVRLNSCTNRRDGGYAEISEYEIRNDVELQRLWTLKCWNLPLLPVSRHHLCCHGAPGSRRQANPHLGQMLRLPRPSP
jgi:hypothetical protein